MFTDEIDMNESERERENTIHCVYKLNKKKKENNKWHLQMKWTWMRERERERREEKRKFSIRNVIWRHMRKLDKREVNRYIPCNTSVENYVHMQSFPPISNLQTYSIIQIIYTLTGVWVVSVSFFKLQRLFSVSVCSYLYHVPCQALNVSGWSSIGYTLEKQIIKYVTYATTGWSVYRPSALLFPEKLI